MHGRKFGIGTVPREAKDVRYDEPGFGWTRKRALNLRKFGESMNLISKRWKDSLRFTFCAAPRRNTSAILFGRAKKHSKIGSEANLPQSPCAGWADAQGSFEGIKICVLRCIALRKEMTQVLFTCLFPRDGRGGFLRLAGRVVTSRIRPSDSGC